VAPSPTETLPAVAVVPPREALLGPAEGVPVDEAHGASDPALRTICVLRG
jgi:hypothetical protein